LQIGGGPYIRKGQGITARLSGRLNFLAIRDKKAASHA
jgi:hypothetical protein